MMKTFCCFGLKKSRDRTNFDSFLTRRRSLETLWHSSNHGPDQSKSILDHPGVVSSARRYRKVHQWSVETHLLQIYLLKYSSPDCDHAVLMTWRNLRSKLHVSQVGSPKVWGCLFYDIVHQLLNILQDISCNLLQFLPGAQEKRMQQGNCCRSCLFQSF